MLKRVAECQDLVSNVPKLLDYGKDPRVQLSLLLCYSTLRHLLHKIVDAQCSCLEVYYGLASQIIAAVLCQNNGFLHGKCWVY